MPEHGYTISSPYEPNSSGELINFGDLKSLMMHAKFHHRSSESREEDFYHI